MNIARVALLAGTVLATGPAMAGPDARQDLIDGMAKCAAVADNMARLACYDALNPTLRAAQEAPPPAPPPAVVPPPATVPAATPPAQQADNGRPWYDLFGVSPSHQTTPETFGSEGLQAPPPPPGAAPVEKPPEALESITATVTDYSFNPYDKFVVFLDNGQIWKQLASDTGGKARFNKGGTNTIVISRGFIGSYNANINDGPTYKVTRVK
jgi:hypothetical protein